MIGADICLGALITGRDFLLAPLRSESDILSLSSDIVADAWLFYVAVG